MDWVRMVGSEAGKAPWLTAEVAMYVGVALLVAGFAYRRPYLVAKARKVLIAAHNEEKVIGEKIASVLTSDYPLNKLEVLVGSDASTDHTNAILQQIKETNPSLRFFP